MKLPEPEIRRLVAAAQAGDVQARNAIIIDNQGLVGLAAKWAVRQPLYRKFEVRDLAGWGQFGLFDAVQFFDLRRTTKFSTFANWRIRGAMYDGARRGDWLRKRTFFTDDFRGLVDQRSLSPLALSRASELQVAVDWELRCLDQRARRIATDEINGTFNAKELAVELGISTKRVYQILQVSMRKVRLGLTQFNPLRESLSA